MPTERARRLLRAALHFDAAGGKSTHAPMVFATVGAVRTRLIVDTGSDVHLLTRDVAEAAGLRLSTVDQGTDHAGTDMESWTIGDVEVRLDEAEGEERLRLRDVVSIPAPAAFTELGIGGAISPQRLHASAFAVIDQVADELVLVDGTPDGVRARMLERRPAPEVLSLPRRRGADLPIVDAAIEPHAPVLVLLNTGGRHTEFDPTTVPGLPAGDLKRIGTGVSGAPVMGAAAGAQSIAVGGRHVAVESLMLRMDMGDPPAMIGQDVLRGTVLAVGPDQGTPVLWQVETR